MAKRKQPAEAPEEERFEAMMARLDEIAERMEGEALELDESLALFEEGVRLLRRTQERLDRSEARIQELLADGEGYRLEPWDGA